MSHPHVALFATRQEASAFSRMLRHSYRARQVGTVQPTGDGRYAISYHRATLTAELYLLQRASAG
jgi:hypothetical protein